MQACRHADMQTYRHTDIHTCIHTYMDKTRDIPTSAQDVLRELMGEDLLNCAGSLMVEHPIMSQYVERIEGRAAHVSRGKCSLRSKRFVSPPRIATGGFWEEETSGWLFLIRVRWPRQCHGPLHEPFEGSFFQPRGQDDMLGVSENRDYILEKCSILRKHDGQPFNLSVP